MSVEVISHLDNIEIDITYADLTDDGLLLDTSTVLIVEELDDSTLTGMAFTAIGDNASKYVDLPRGTEIPDGAMSAWAKAAYEAHYAQTGAVSSLRMVVVDTVGGDTPETVRKAFEALGYKPFACVVPVSDMSVVATVASGFNNETEKLRTVIYFNQGIVDTGSTGVYDAWRDPVELGPIDALSDYVKFSMVNTFQEDSGITASPAAAPASQYAAVDWVEKSAGGNLVLQGVPVISYLTPEAKANMEKNHVNTAMRFFGTDTYWDPGVTILGRPVYQLYAAAVFENQLMLALAKLKYDAALRREKLPQDEEGQALGLGAIKGVVKQMVYAKNLQSKETAIFLGAAVEPYERALPFSADDLTNRRARYEVGQYFLNDLRLFKLSVILS